MYHRLFITFNKWFLSKRFHIFCDNVANLQIYKTNPYIEEQIAAEQMNKYCSDIFPHGNQ